LRGLDLNQRPLGYEPNELPDCSTPRLNLEHFKNKTSLLKLVFNKSLSSYFKFWLRGLDLNQRPLGYEPNELPDCSTPRLKNVILY
jgi:signal recognition particle subunit SEC65